MPAAANCLTLLILLFASGCSSISVQSSYDDEVDFSQLRTFDWLEVKPQAQTAISDEAVLKLIGTELTAKGLQRRSGKPDVLIAVHRSVDGVLNTRHSGYEFREGRIRRYTLQEGTLVVDIVRAGSQELVWRGTAEGAFRFDGLPAEQEELLTEVLHDMFADYPPRR